MNIHVMFSLALNEVLRELVPDFERSTGHKVAGQCVPTAQMVRRLKEGDSTDLVLVSEGALGELIDAGAIAADSRVDLATCGVGVAVRAGAARPDLSSAEALRQAVLAAKSIVYSKGPSGVYMQALFERMGVAEEIRSRVKIVQGEPAGAVVARGDAEIAFQQVCELLPVAGIDFVGPLPAEIQELTLFAAGVHVRAKAPEAARELVRVFKSPMGAAVMRKAGLKPMEADR